MSQIPPVPRDHRKTDAEHLTLLSIFHFVGAGLGLLGLLFLLVHYLMFQMFFANPKLWEGQNQTPPPAEFFAIFKWFYLVLGVWFLGAVILNVISGFALRARKNRTFSLVVAGINCVYIPLGTILGVFTIIVLIRDSVREMYET